MHEHLWSTYITASKYVWVAQAQIMHLSFQVYLGSNYTSTLNQLGIM